MTASPEQDCYAIAQNWYVIFADVQDLYLMFAKDVEPFSIPARSL